MKLTAENGVRGEASAPDADELDTKEGATGGQDALEIAASTHTDKQLLKFKQAIRSNPNQVSSQSHYYLIASLLKLLRV